MPANTQVCPACGHDHTVSVTDDTLDQMVTQASVPNLATLFRRAKETGAIAAFEGYAGGPPPF